jgi:hypothetical protein
MMSAAMTLRIRFLVEIILLAAVFGALGCAKTQSPTATPPTTPHETVEPIVPATTGASPVILELDGQRVEVTLPTAWKLVPGQSDPKAGLVAFAPDGATPERTDSLFLDGARAVQLPGSLDEAADRASATDDCDSQGACVVLGRANLPGNGVLVSVRKPHAVFVETWHAAPNGRVVRCGAESSDRDASSETTWMQDPAALERVRIAAEDLCRSVKLPP